MNSKIKATNLVCFSLLFLLASVWLTRMTVVVDWNGVLLHVLRSVLTQRH